MNHSGAVLWFMAYESTVRLLKRADKNTNFRVLQESYQNLLITDLKQFMV